MVKAFLKKCAKVRKVCIYCNHPLVKLVLQNSRLIRAGVAARQEKAAAAAEKEEERMQEESVDRQEKPKEPQTLEEMLDAQSYITSEQVRN